MASVETPMIHITIYNIAAPLCHIHDSCVVFMDLILAHESGEMVEGDMRTEALLGQ